MPPLPPNALPPPFMPDIFVSIIIIDIAEIVAVILYSLCIWLKIDSIRSLRLSISLVSWSLATVSGARTHRHNSSERKTSDFSLVQFALERPRANLVQCTEITSEIIPTNSILPNYSSNNISILFL